MAQRRIILPTKAEEGDEPEEMKIPTPRRIMTPSIIQEEEEEKAQEETKSNKQKNKVRGVFKRISGFQRDCFPFLRFTLCQAISLLFSSICGWVLSIHVLEKTESTFSYALTAIALMIPGFILSPISGYLADRFNKKMIILISDSGAFCCSLSIALICYYKNDIRLRHVLIINFVNGICSAFQTPAVIASIPGLVPVQHREMAVVVREILLSLTEILTPAIGGAISGMIPISKLVFIDLLGYLIGCIALLFTRFPSQSNQGQGQEQEHQITQKAKRDIKKTLYEMWLGFKYLKENKGIGILVVGSAFGRFITGLSYQVLTPFLLTFLNVNELGIVLSIIPSGFIIGSTFIATVHFSKWPTRLLCYSLLLQSVVLQLMSHCTSRGGGIGIILITLCGFLFVSVMPPMTTPTELILTTCVDPSILGRVSAASTALASIAQFIAVLISGPLVDFIFEPFVEFHFTNANKVPFISTMLYYCIGSSTYVRGKGTIFYYSVIGIVELIGAIALFKSKKLKSLDYVVIERTITPASPKSFTLTPHELLENSQK